MLDKLVKHLSARVHRASAVKLFTVLVYGWFLINAVLVLSTKNLLWGVDNVFFRQGHTDTFIENFIYQLIYAPYKANYVFYLHIAAAAASLIDRRWTFIPRIITWITALMLFYSAVEAFNSGMMIMMLLAFYCSFIYTASNNPYRIVLGNLAVYACMIQIAIVYATAALYKLGGDQWLGGTALYYSLHIDRFSSSFLRDSNVIKSQTFMAICTYAALAYQILFPIIVWFKKGRNWFLFIGILFHLFIGIFMHLWDFALAMIFSYAVFMNEKTAERFTKLFTFKVRSAVKSS